MTAYHSPPRGTREGKPSLPQKKPLDSDQKRQLAVSLKDNSNITGANIGRLLDVTRQAVYLYLKPGGEPDA